MRRIRVLPLHLARRRLLPQHQCLQTTRRHLTFGADSPEKGMYSPIIDVAVGPFATHRQCVWDYDRMTKTFGGLISKMLSFYARNLRTFGSDYPPQDFHEVSGRNQNARCFMAIEIEKGNPDLKYLMGSMINASALGRIGILVAWNHCRLSSLLRLRESFLYMNELGKNSFDTTNLIFLGKDQFMRVLGRFAASSIGVGHILANPPFSMLRDNRNNDY
jgi:hypothetical protein